MNNKNILLIEDDLIVQRVHKTMLDKLGCNVDIAENGKTALEIAKNNLTYQIIFVDIGLPDMSGFEVITNLLRQNKPSNYDPAIIAITGYCGASEYEACVKAGATTVLKKPVVINTMREIIYKYTQTETTCVN
jgi:two-component system aerobic respiration control sensor histidine kinase ArcB